MEEIRKEDLTPEEQEEVEELNKLALKGYVVMKNDIAQELFRDARLLHIIRDRLVDYDKAFGEAKTLLGLWINYDKDIEDWAKDILGHPKKTFLDDLADYPLPEGFDETIEEEQYIEDPQEEEWKEFVNE